VATRDDVAEVTESGTGTMGAPPVPVAAVDVVTVDETEGDDVSDDIGCGCTPPGDASPPLGAEVKPPVAAVVR
jgi:hypothetical protein